VCCAHIAFFQNLFSLSNSQPRSYKIEVMNLFIAVLTREYCIRICVVVARAFKLSKVLSDCTSEFGCYYSVGIELSVNFNARVIGRPLIVCISFPKNGRNPFIMTLNAVRAA